MRVYYHEVMWCHTHLSPADTRKIQCDWDYLAGHRPGRGKCDIRQVRLTIEELE